MLSIGRNKTSQEGKWHQRDGEDWENKMNEGKQQGRLNTALPVNRSPNTSKQSIYGKQYMYMYKLSKKRLQRIRRFND